MDITTAVLCDFAQVRDRLLFVSSGAVSRLYRAELPSQLGVNLALIIEVPRDAAGKPQKLTVRVVNRHGAEMSHVVTTFQVGEEGLFPNEIQQIPMIVSLARTPVKAWGTHQVRVFLNDDLVQTVTCYVVPSTGVVNPVDPAPASVPAPEPEPAVDQAEAEVPPADAEEEAEPDLIESGEDSSDDDATDEVDDSDAGTADASDADASDSDDEDPDGGGDDDEDPNRDED